MGKLTSVFILIKFTWLLLKKLVNLCTKFYQIIYNVINLSSCKNFDWKFLWMFFLCETHIYMLVSCVGLFPTFHVQYTEPRCSVYSLCSCFGGFPLIKWLHCVILACQRDSHVILSCLFTDLSLLFGIFYFLNLYNSCLFCILLLLNEILYILYQDILWHSIWDM